MTAMIIIYGVVALFALTAVSLAVFNIIALSRATASIHLLEQNIEKKALEFDAIRKEQLAGQSAPANSFEDTITESVVPATSAGGSADAPQIQIFRNVRKSHFNDPVESQNTAPVEASPYVSSDTLPQQYPVQSSLPDSGMNTDQNSYGVSYPSAQQGLPASEMRAGPDNTTAPDNDIMAVVNEDPSSGFAKPGEQLTIPVYSPVNRCADYAPVSQQLQSLAQMSPLPALVLDFSNITSIHQAELTYLQQVATYVRSIGGRMFLHNCQGQVGAILQQDQILAPLVKV